MWVLLHCRIDAGFDFLQIQIEVTKFLVTKKRLNAAEKLMDYLTLTPMIWKNVNTFTGLFALPTQGARKLELLN